MTEHEKETSFLRHLIRFDETDECRKLEERIARVQCEQRCVRRAMALVALFAAGCGAVLAYGILLEENFPLGEHLYFNQLIGELGLASLICLVALLGPSMTYRRKLNRLRAECRRLITGFLELRLGTPPLRHNDPETGNLQVARGATDRSGSPDRLNSLAESTPRGVNKLSSETNPGP